MFTKFVKYQSLGNDFILFDCREMTVNELTKTLHKPSWMKFVQQICRRRISVGADGVLVLKKQPSQIELLLFNADGSQAEKCLNGLRCVAHYLKNIEHCSDNIELLMGEDVVLATVDNTTNLVSLQVDGVRYIGKHTLNIAGKSIVGHIVSVGNPHFVVLHDLEQQWIEQHAQEITKHTDFSRGTNVEFARHVHDYYELTVCERGVGFVLSCGSGAAAVMMALKTTRSINNDKEITLRMAGGKLYSSINSHGRVNQRAPVDFVYTTLKSAQNVDHE